MPTYLPLLTVTSVSLSALQLATAGMLLQLVLTRKECRILPYFIAAFVCCGAAWGFGFPLERCFLVLMVITMAFQAARVLQTAFPKYRLVAHLFVVSAGFSLVVSSLWTMFIAGLVSQHGALYFQVAFILINVIWWVLGTSASTLGWFAQYLPIISEYRKRPVDVIPALPGWYPRVSVHVPCYMEPPEVVIKTLDALSRLDYPNFEVILIDNNTTDVTLWHPLRDHCIRLGERFKFFHIEGLEGAKGGALNFALQHTDDSVDLIGVLDSDFESATDFLSRLVVFFANPKIAFVQTPHDYRNFEDSYFQRGCYWEYRRKHALVYPGINEWDASLLTGTMCLVRRSALIEVGSWSNVCICEDSELSLRLGVAGYEGQYISETFGRGLIPETFYEYRKQRARWIAGTVQQLRMHWKTFLPRLGRSTEDKCSRPKKIISFLYRGGLLVDIMSILLLVAFFSLAASLVVRGVVVSVPSALLVLVLVSGSAQLISLEVMRILMNCSRWDMYRSILSDIALTHVRVVAAFEGLLRVRPFKWNRTSKFIASPSKHFGLATVGFEIAFSILGFTTGYLFWRHARPSELDLVLFASIAGFIVGLAWSVAVYIAVRAELDLRKRSTGRREREVVEVTTEVKAVNF